MEVAAVDGSQFKSCYELFPDPLLLQTPEGTWLTNPAADALGLSQTDLDRLSEWDGSSPIWLSRQFFYVQGHRTADGLFLLLVADSFLSSTTDNLSSQLRQTLSQAFNSLALLKESLTSDTSPAIQGWISGLTQALFRIFRMATELEHSTANELSRHKSCLDLTQWLDSLTTELRYWCPASDKVTLRAELPSAPLAAMANYTLLDYLVTHLVSNAIKAASGQEAEIVLSLKKNADQAALTIHCNADAFSPEVLTDPLWNQPTRLLPGRGLGLGVPITQRIAALHGGTLMASHTKDGSQITLSLPTAIPEGYLASPALRPNIIDEFSPVRVVLSDALSVDAFHPHYLTRSNK